MFDESLKSMEYPPPPIKVSKIMEKPCKTRGEIANTCNKTCSDTYGGVDVIEMVNAIAATNFIIPRRFERRPV